MKRNNTTFVLIVVLTFAIVKSFISLIFSTFVDFGETETTKTSASQAISEERPITFDPPAPEEDPPKIREAVMFGYNILMGTQKYAARYIGNKLNCKSCPFEAGRIRETLSLVGVAAKYPIYGGTEHSLRDLAEQTNSCFEKSLNETRLPPDSKEMESIIAYYHWISRGLPIYVDLPWLGIDIWKRKFNCKTTISRRKSGKENGK